MSGGVPVWPAPRCAAAIIALGDGPLNGDQFKVAVHAVLWVIVVQARALAFPDQIRQCVRALS